MLWISLLFTFLYNHGSTRSVIDFDNDLVLYISLMVALCNTGRKRKPLGSVSPSSSSHNGIVDFRIVYIDYFSFFVDDRWSSCLLFVVQKRRPLQSSNGAIRRNLNTPSAEVVNSENRNPNITLPSYSFNGMIFFVTAGTSCYYESVIFRNIVQFHYRVVCDFVLLLMYFQLHQFPIIRFFILHRSKGYIISIQQVIILRYLH